jgi:transposase InsO family protein
MDIHHNAHTTPHSRAALVRRVRAGELPKTVAAGVGVCDKTVRNVCIDDHSRLAYAEVLPNERKETTTAFLSRALDHFQALGISVARIMTDNGSAYRSYLIADLCRSRRMRHIFTRLYTPRTNGKAERFI